MRSFLVENLGRKKWKKKKKQLLVLFVSLNVCLKSDFFSTKVSKDLSRNAWDRCPAELKNRLCKKCNSPNLLGTWQVFTATLIQEYLVLCLFSPLHICINDISDLQAAHVALISPRELLTASQRCAVPSVGLRSFHSFSPLPEALLPACISSLRTNYALWEHCNERHWYYPAWVGNHVHMGHIFHLCWLDFEKRWFQQFWGVLPLTPSQGKQIPQISK